MKIKITKNIKLAISPRENKQFFAGDIHDLTDNIATRLIELGAGKEFVKLEKEEKQPKLKPKPKPQIKKNK